jgi:beta-lactamase class A
MKLFASAFLTVILLGMNNTLAAPPMNPDLKNYTLTYDSPIDDALQAQLGKIDAGLRAKYGMTTNQTSLGLLDLRTLRLAMIYPDREDYAASVAKIGILFAYFDLHPDAATNLDAQTRHELGLMIKPSSNEMAAKYSQRLGLKQIETALESSGFYDASHGGGIWVGKHYGVTGERVGDPVGDNSHAVTVRQVLRFYLLMEQGKLVSLAASRTMREIFASPDIPAEEIKFVKGLEGRHLEILRKSGTWENWLHDSAIIAGPDRCYILVALTNHSRGDEYLADLAAAVDDVMIKDGMNP